MKNRCVLAGPVLALALQSALANTSADEARLLATLKRTYPATTFTSVAASEVPGIYEVWMGPNVAFVSAKNLQTRQVVVIHRIGTGLELQRRHIAQHHRRPASVVA